MLAQFGNIQAVLPLKQPVWDSRGMLMDKALVKASVNFPILSSRFPVHGDYGCLLFQLLYVNCNLDDK